MTTKLFTREERRKLYAIGIPSGTVSQWNRRLKFPLPDRRTAAVAALGRDPWEGMVPRKTGRPMGRTADVRVAPPPDDEVVIESRIINTPMSVPRDPLQINPCAVDGVCLAVRRAVFRGSGNTAADQWNTSACSNCKIGVARERAAALERKPEEGDSHICECGEYKHPDAINCRECATEKRRSA